VLPIALLFATVLTYARASQDREITAIRSAGISPRVAMVPALLIGILFSLIASWALHWVLPRAHYLKYRVVAEGVRTVLLQTGLLGDQLSYGDLMMTWERKDASGAWRDVIIQIRRDGAGSEALGEGLFLAESAAVEIEDDERLVLVLHGAREAVGDRRLPETTRISINMRDIVENNRREEDEKDMSSDQLLAEVDRGLHDFPGAARYYVAQRTCFALLPILLAPIGFAIGVYARDRGRVLALVFAMVPIVLFYMGDFVGAKLVRATDWSGFAFTPAAILVACGVPFCWRLLRA
jgi:lipopolysaccharide export LptBFGC system permease protein LptF